MKVANEGCKAPSFKIEQDHKAANALVELRRLARVSVIQKEMSRFFFVCLLGLPFVLLLNTEIILNILISYAIRVLIRTDHERDRLLSTFNYHLMRDIIFYI